MHDHDNNNGGMKSMMWMMVICCAVPLVLILIFGAGGKALGAPTWIVFGGVAVMVLAHFFMMGKSHNHSDEKNEMTEGGNISKDDKDKKNHSGHGCCH